MAIKNAVALLAVLMGFSFGGAAVASAQEDTPAQPRILAIGDSLMSWHSLTGRAIPDVLAEELDEPTENRSLGGARMIFKVPFVGNAGMQISHQVIEGDWDWIVMNGGGNDLLFGCGCERCDKKMDNLISEGGDSGEIPRVVNELRDTGAKILYLGYLRSPGVDSMIESCRDEGDELESRIANFAQSTKDMYFLSNADLVPEGDLSYHTLDRIHPSLKASEAIGKRVADMIRKYDRTR